MLVPNHPKSSFSKTFIEREVITNTKEHMVIDTSFKHLYNYNVANDIPNNQWDRMAELLSFISVFLLFY